MGIEYCMSAQITKRDLEKVKMHKQAVNGKDFQGYAPGTLRFRTFVGGFFKKGSCSGHYVFDVAPEGVIFDGESADFSHFPTSPAQLTTPKDTKHAKGVATQKAEKAEEIAL